MFQCQNNNVLPRLKLLILFLNISSRKSCFFAQEVFFFFPSFTSNLNFEMKKMCKPMTKAHKFMEKFYYVPFKFSMKHKPHLQSRVESIFGLNLNFLLFSATKSERSWIESFIMEVVLQWSEKIWKLASSKRVECTAEIWSFGV